jgi:hypothetical protein
LGKTFTIYASDGELITRIYRELEKLNSQRTNDPVKKRQINQMAVFKGRSPNCQ